MSETKSRFSANRIELAFTLAIGLITGGAALSSENGVSAISIQEVSSSIPQKGSLVLGGVPTFVWGSYRIRHMLFPDEQWEIFVVVIPKDIGQGALGKIASEFYKKYPRTRARFFNDRRYIQQYVDRDRYINDKTGKVKEVDFPPTEWVQDHLLGDINNRSRMYNRQWMLEDRYGSMMRILP